jgi:hypothetical protein
MNFEFKSTFNKANNKPAGRRSFFPHLPFVVWLLVFNVTTVLTVAILYLSNMILPGTIGSRPDAIYWILLIETVAALIGVTSTFAVLRLIFDAFPLIKGKVKSELKEFRASLITVYLVINLIKHPRQLDNDSINKTNCIIQLLLETQPSLNIRNSQNN